MISWRPYRCKACGEERFQRIIFMGMEFQYECPCCGALCLFTEGMHYQFQDNFHDKKLNRYLATIRDEQVIDGSSGETTQKFLVLQRHRSHPVGSIGIEKLSDKPQRGKFFVASAGYDHFQDALRGVVRMRDHVLNRNGKETYNVLIVPTEYELYYQPRNKLLGVDELWTIPFHRSQRWPFINNHDDVVNSSAMNGVITGLFDRLEGIAETVSKRPGPLPQGRGPLLEMLDPGDVELRTADGSIIKGKHVAILVKQRAEGRATLDNNGKLSVAFRMVRQHGLSPIIVTATPGEENIARSFPPKHVFNAASLREQVAFYLNCCMAVVGTNTSACNFPAMCGLPIFALAQRFAYPCDFYCMGKMLSAYDPDIPLGGNVEKPDNVVEVRFDEEEYACVSKCKEAFDEWMMRHVLAQEN